MKLIELFNELSLHPKNAKELKGLIVRLALRGELSVKWRNEHPNIEHASKLYNRISKNKQSLINRRKLKLRKVSEINVNEDMKYTIPSSWEWYKFSDVVFIQEGPGIRKWQYRESGVKLLNVKNIVGDKLILDNTDKHVERKEFDQKYQHFKVEEGDLLFASSGGSWGKSAWFENPGYDVMLNTSMIRMCFYGKDWFPEYLKTFISSGFFVDQMSKQLVGMQPNFGSTHLSRIYIPIPPLQEQKVIVSIVEKLFTEVEQLEQKTVDSIQLKKDYAVSALQNLAQADDVVKTWQDIQPHFKTFFNEKANIKKLRKTILQLAVQGKLTANWRKQRRLSGAEAEAEVEPASELLKRIAAEKQKLIEDKKIRKEKPLPEITEDDLPVGETGKPFALPDGWEWCRFMQIFDIRDGTHDSPKDSSEPNSFPLITSRNFKDGKIDFKSARRISEDDYFKVIKRSKVHKGDMLFSMIGGNIGNQVEVGDFTDYAIKNVALFKHYKSGIPAKGFLKFYCQFIAMNLQNQASGGAQPFVSLKYFRNLIIGLPSLEEQKAIVKIVDALMAECDALEREIEQRDTLIEDLMSSCLHEMEDKNSSNDLEELRMVAESGEKY